MIIKQGRKKLFNAKYLGKFTFGLMFRKVQPIVLETFYPSISHSTLHTYFVRSPIDIIWINNKKIVSLKRKVKPFKFKIFPKKPAQYIIETPAGFIKKHKLKNGQSISLTS